MPTSGRWPPAAAFPGADRRGASSRPSISGICRSSSDDLTLMLRELDERLASVPRRDDVVAARAEQVRDAARGAPASSSATSTVTARTSSRPRPALRRSGAPCRPKLRREPERGSAPDLAFDPDVAAHQLHQPRRDRQAEPRAAEAPGGRAVGLRERLEDELLLVARDADARVDDGEVQADLAGQLRRDVDAQADSPRLREFDGVADQVHAGPAAGAAHRRRARPGPPATTSSASASPFSSARDLHACPRRPRHVSRSGNGSRSSVSFRDRSSRSRGCR